MITYNKFSTVFLEYNKLDACSEIFFREGDMLKNGLLLLFALGVVGSESLKQILKHSA